MKSVFLLRATHIDGNEIAAGSIAEVDDAIASALISDGAADAHPSAIDAAKKLVERLNAGRLRSEFKRQMAVQTAVRNSYAINLTELAGAG